MLTIDPDILARMKSPCATPSMAATFPTFGNPRRNHLRNAPIPVRQTRIARRLAHCGAMEPEGCTADDLEKARCAHRLHVDVITEILRTLWAFRLLGYRPADTLGITYEQIAGLVSGQH